MTTLQNYTIFCLSLITIGLSACSSSPNVFYSLMGRKMSVEECYNIGEKALKELNFETEKASKDSIGGVLNYKYTANIGCTDDSWRAILIVVAGPSSNECREVVDKISNYYRLKK
ncbi:MAG: hypothetical protein HY279_01970 [Nitrospinae bacterium]|nr:hypothetical protein [Nitrospinota bacterium]